MGAREKQPLPSELIVRLESLVQHQGGYRAGATDKCFKLNNLQNRKLSLWAGTVVDFVAVRTLSQLSTAGKISLLNLKDFREACGGRPPWSRTRFKTLLSFVEICCS